MRSSIPPCPGNRVPLSLTPASRLMADIVISPTNPPKLMSNPAAIDQTKGSVTASPRVRRAGPLANGVSQGASSTASNVVHNRPPRSPSSDFFGETFGVIGIMRGTETRERVPGWITVKWTSDPPAGSCGRSTVGVDGGFIELNVSGACSCGKASRVYPRLIRHELGHAMGYYHTDDPDDVMFGRAISSAQCEATPSERERRLARFVHAELR